MLFSRSSLVVILVGAMASVSTLAATNPPEAVPSFAALPEDGPVGSAQGSLAQAPGSPDMENRAVSTSARVANLSADGAMDVLSTQVDDSGSKDGDDEGHRGGPPGCGPGSGNCYLPNGSPGCDNIPCCTIVCNADTFCCLYEWDNACAEMAWQVCDPPTGIGACCNEENECTGVMPDADCDWSWYEGWNCGDITCSDAALDLCPGEVIAIGSSVTGSTLVATIDSQFPYCGTSITAPGVWYTVIGNGHTITATTCNSFADYDTKISVYCSSCAEPTCVGGNDDSCSEFTYRSTVTWCSEIGGEYFILVHGFSAGVGNFRLDIIDEGSCSNPAPGCMPPIGACCDGLTCSGNTEPGACDGAWYPGEDCDTFVCPTGACCDSLECVDTVPADECDAEWHRGQVCPGFSCPYGACCNGLECTGTTSEDDCFGSWYAGMTCPELDCVTTAYCDACYTNCGPAGPACPDSSSVPDDWITNVTFNTIDNDTYGEGCECSYGDYTSISTYVLPASTYDLTVSFCSEGIWTEHVRAWFDWDRDGEFEDSESYYVGSGIDATVSLPITVPANAAPGCTRFRVIEDYSTDPGPGGDCPDTSYGETEDYTVCIGPPPECGNDECEPPLETCDDCPGDCDVCFCGNGTCDADEDCATCEQDCGLCTQGACCDGFTCTGNMSEPECDYNWSEGEDCATFGCPFGACCVDMSCTGNTLPDDCGESWYQGADCDTFECPVFGPNDYCPGNQLAVPDSIQDTTTDATPDTEYPTCGTSITTNGVWFWVVGNGHNITATTCNAYSDYDTKISVYCSDCDDPTCVDGNDDSCTGHSGLRSTVTWCSESGAIYYILVHGYSTATGNFQLDILDEGSCSDPAPGCIPPIGACCNGLTCTENTPPNECDGVWYAGEDCANFACPTGACCNSLECSETVPSDECDGEWYIGESCPGFECPYGACCNGLECVDTTSQSDCFGAWYAYMTCPEFDCVTAAYCDMCYSNCGPGETPCPADTSGIPDDWISNVTFNTIDNDTLAEGCECSYGDYTTMSTHVTPGSTYTLSVSFCSEDLWTEHVRAWFDWNRDGEFEDSESYYLGSGVDATLTLPITIPANAAPGCTRFRVIEDYYADPGPEGDCGDEIYGETEDYTVCTGDPPDCGDGDCQSPYETCDGCPQDCGDCYCGNGTCDSGEDCATCENDCGQCTQGACCDGFSCTGTMSEPECAYLWYEGEDCSTFTCPWGACCTGLDCTGNTAPEDCSADWFMGQDCATFACPEGEYCEPCYSNCGPGVVPCPGDTSGTPDDWITNVTFNTINNDTLGEGCECSFGDYSSLSTSVAPGETHTLSVSFCSEAYWTQHVRAWIDWDRDYEFEESESYDLGEGVDATLSIDITVPMNAAVGCTRMRVRERYSSDMTDPCEQYTYGEAEDYTVCIEGSCPAGEVEWIDPPDNVIDAGAPSDVNGGPLLGIDEIHVAAPAGAGQECFTLCENDDGGYGANSIVDVIDGGDGTYVIVLLRPLTPLAVTTITYTATGATGTFTCHPANANADSAAGTIDILSVIDYLNGAEEPPFGLYSVDVNRSGLGEASDILSVIDLLNGAGVFPAYLNTTLPTNTDCP